MAPEQYRGEEADARTDQFAFCVALYEALFREAPFSADHPAARLQTLDDRPRLPTDDRAVPREVREAIVRGLSPRREDRFDSMDDLLRALDHGRYAPRRKRLAVATVATAVLVALVAWWAVRPRPALPTGGRVLVLPIAGDAETSPGIAGGLAELVGSSLDELPGVDVVTPGAELAELRQEASEGPEEAGGFGRDALDRLRRAYGADLVLAARIHEAEALYTVEYAVAGDDTAWRERSVRAGDPVTAVNEMAARVGLLLAPEANRVDLRRIFSEDPFVNRLYATGVAQLMRGGPSVAADYFRVALDQDPSFHWARLRLAEARHLEGGDPAEAEALLDEVQAAAEASRDARLLAATLHERGSQALDRGRLEAAAAPLHRALELHRQLGETTQVIEDLLALGLLGYRAEELEEAERWWREAAELAATDEQELATVKATNNLALLLMEQDRLDEAGEHFERAATTFRRLGMRQGLATVLGNLGQVAGDQGRLDDARQALDEELALQEALGNRKEVLVNLVNQAWLASLSGDCGGIRDVVERGSELARQQDTPLLEANLLIHDYLCATITGQGLERQEAQLRHALEIAVASEVPGMDHGLQVALAEHLVRGGRVGEARAFLLDVEAAGHEVTGDPGLAPYVAGVRGRLALAEGRTADAVPLLEAAVRDLPIPRSEDREILERARRELGANADQRPPGR
jgi:tetratricopeptide (TPR) repeat protein